MKEYSCQKCGYTTMYEPESPYSGMYDNDDETYLCWVCWEEIE